MCDALDRWLLRGLQRHCHRLRADRFWQNLHHGNGRWFEPGCVGGRGDSANHIRSIQSGRGGQLEGFQRRGGTSPVVCLCCLVSGNTQRRNKGFVEESPYDLIIIDCPIYNLNKIFIDQLSKEGRLIYIEKINNELAKAYKIIKTKGSFSKEYLFDVFSEFSIDRKNEEFEF